MIQILQDLALLPQCLNVAGLPFNITVSVNSRGLDLLSGYYFPSSPVHAQLEGKIYTRISTLSYELTTNPSENGYVATLKSMNQEKTMRSSPFGNCIVGDLETDVTLGLCDVATSSSLLPASFSLILLMEDMSELGLDFLSLFAEEV